MGRKERIRQHVNPLGERFVLPRAGPLPALAHLGPDAPIEVELGCADAKFSFEMARAHPRIIFVGLDIREKMVARNARHAAEQRLANLAFGYVNINVDLDRVFEADRIHRFHLLFPDPWFKTKHHKRRVVEPWALAVMRNQLVPGGELHIASDVFEVALDAMAEIEGRAGRDLGYANMLEPWSFWRGNPFAGSSRREDTTVARGHRVWRMRYRLEPNA
jgi:tRNA (guanine-N7-)-methyltransferase